MRSVKVGSGVAILALGVTGALAVSAQASYFKSKGLYDCMAGTSYADSYQFKSNHRYSFGVDTNGKLSHATTGRYKRRGNKIIGLSGVLKKHHESLLIRKSYLQLVIAGHPSAIACRLRGSTSPTNPTTTPPTPTTPTTPTTPAIPLGRYLCYHSYQQTNGSYGSTYRPSIILYSDATYQVDASLRYPSAWHQSGDSIVFTQGPLWSGANQDVGTYYPSGVSMPQAQSNVPASGYTLVIKDTIQAGGVPPSQEFSSTDDPNGSSSVPMSFDYCKPGS